MKSACFENKKPHDNNKIMLEIFLVIFVLLIVAGLCVHHYIMQSRATNSFEEDLKLIQEASQKSVKATYINEPVQAKELCDQGLQILKVLEKRYSVQKLNEIAKCNVGEMIDIIQDQSDRIKSKIYRDRGGPQNPLHHPLAVESGLKP